MNYLDLFSGLGGFPLGAYWAGWHFDAHYFSEVDPWAVELYQKRFPDAIPLGDIRGIDGKALADTERIGQRQSTQQADASRDGGASRVGAKVGDRGQCTDQTDVRMADWIITGGFPCTDVSYAGKGAGLAGEQSGLWYEMHRVIRELRPRFAIIENVAALFTRGIDAVLGSLSKIGYDACWETIRASDVGAPHRRERVWIVAYPASADAGGGSGEQQGQESTHREPAFVLPTASGGSREAEAGGNHRDVADTTRQQPHGTRGTRRRWAEPTDGGSATRVRESAQPKEEKISDSTSGGQQPGSSQSNVGRFQDEAVQSMGNPDYWTIGAGLGGRTDGLHAWMDGWEQGLPRLATKIPHRVDRLRGLGNSIVPQIAELIFRQLDLIGSQE